MLNRLKRGVRIVLGIYFVLVGIFLGDRATAAAKRPNAKGVSAQSFQLTTNEIESRLRCASTKVLIKQFPPNVSTLHKITMFEGTAFFIDEQGDMVTAAHIFTELPAIPPGDIETHFMIRTDGSSFEFKPPSTKSLLASAKTDLVLVKTNIHPPCYLYTKPSIGLKPEDIVFTVGYPASSTATFQDAKGKIHQKALFQRAAIKAREIHGLRDSGFIREMLRADFYSDHGMSGSAIVDSRGFVRAIAVEKEHNGHGYTWATPVEALIPDKSLHKR